MKRLGIAALLVALTLTGVAPAARAASARQFVLSPEGNHLWAYDAATRERQLLARAENGDDPGAKAPNGMVRDINGQICVSPDGSHVITGEDTVFGDGDSHDPRIAGWGWFAIAGDAIGNLTIDQVGKLAPAAGSGPTYTGDPDNYGCGFLDGNRLLTTAIGSTLPGEEANGQLFLWFGPFERKFHRNTDPKSGVSFFVGEVEHCEIDHTLATAGGVSVAPNGDVYVAANRPTEIPGGDPSAIWRYSGQWPRSAAECTPAFLRTHIKKTRVLPATKGLPADPTAPTPSAVLLTPKGTLLVSSVFSGTVSEFTKTGKWIRDVYPLSPVAPRTGPTGNTPYGMAITKDNTLWIADLGIVTASPAPGQGSLIAVKLNKRVGAPTTVQNGLTFPDGLGVYTGRTASKAAPSAKPCANWPMYGNNLQRTFATPCASPITSKTVARLVPAWVVDTPRPVTASPTVADGVVYVGAWDGVMYALDAKTGKTRWKFQTPVAPGATYGPIVSSAAVGDISVDGARQRAVVFGAGPRVYALRATDGRPLWKHDESHGKVDTALEYESSPAIVGDLVLIGRDTHDEDESATAGERGGLFALDAATGKEVWSFQPELEQRGRGCGSVWGSPTVSPDRKTVFLGTANCPYDEFKWNRFTNAVTALDLATGTPKWSFQPTGPPDHDTDFGATPNYFVDRFGRATLGAGKKDGTYYALNPSTGKELWRRHVQDPAPGIGGFIGSPAVSRGNIYGGTAIGAPPYFHSLDGTTGAIRFQGGAGPTYGATAIVNDVVFNAALDDLLKAYNASTGRLLWAAPLSGPGSSGPAIAGDMVFIGAGTSTSDACAKDSFYDAQCVFAFDTALAALGGIHAFRLVLS